MQDKQAAIKKKVLNTLSSDALYELKKTLQRHAIRIHKEFSKEADKNSGITSGYISNLDHETNSQYMIKYNKDYRTYDLYSESMKQFIGEVLCIGFTKILLPTQTPFVGINVDNTYMENYKYYCLDQRLLTNHMSIRSEWMNDYIDFASLIQSKKMPEKNKISGLANVLMSNIVLGNEDISNPANFGISTIPNKKGVFKVKCLDFGRSTNFLNINEANIINKKLTFIDGKDIQKWLASFYASMNNAFNFHIFEFRNATQYVIDVMTNDVIEHYVVQAIAKLKHIRFDPEIYHSIQKTLDLVKKTKDGGKYYNAIYFSFFSQIQDAKSYQSISLPKDFDFKILLNKIYENLSLSILDFTRTWFYVNKKEQISLYSGLNSIIEKIVINDLRCTYEEKELYQIRKKTYPEKYKEFSERIHTELELIGLCFIKALKHNVKCLKEFQERLFIISHFDISAKNKGWFNKDWLLNTKDYCPLTYASDNKITICSLYPFEYALVYNLKFKFNNGCDIHPIVFYHYVVASQNQKPVKDQTSIERKNLIYDKNNIETLVKNCTYDIDDMSVIDYTLYVQNRIIKFYKNKITKKINNLINSQVELQDLRKCINDQETLELLEKKIANLDNELNKLKKDESNYHNRSMIDLCISVAENFSKEIIASHIACYVNFATIQEIATAKDENIITAYILLKTIPLDTDLLQPCYAKLPQAHLSMNSDNAIISGWQVNSIALRGFANLMKDITQLVKRGESGLQPAQLQTLAKHTMQKLSLEDIYLAVTSVYKNSSIHSLNGTKMILDLMTTFIDACLTNHVALFVKEKCDENKNKNFVQTFILSRKYTDKYTDIFQKQF